MRDVRRRRLHVIRQLISCQRSVQDIGKEGFQFKGGSRHDQNAKIAETVTVAS